MTGTRVQASAYDVVVVGGGAAGLSAALVLARARRRIAVVDAGAPRNAPAAHMHGFLSRDGMPPGDLLSEGRAEVAGYGGELIDGQVEEITSALVARLRGGREFDARRVLVATGLRDALPAIPGVAEQWGGAVLHCPYCHGWEVRDQPIGVIAGHPMSVHQALLVRQWSDDVTYFPHDRPLAPEEHEQLMARGVPVVDGTVARLVPDRNGGLRGIALADGDVHPRTAAFIAPLPELNDQLLTKLGCATDDNGCPVIDAMGRTSVDGVWAAGNVATPTASVINAASAGSAAAMAVNADLVQEETQQAVRERRASDSRS
ncbi:NAD(P)/FAD-dependent oxidoreductase [Streptomyces monticola]|uniref:NAD(P)/FAD-dependent oxidoreductase n=1 Tax=Streptomyces monticola TaxID=2666263 RepID=A0ABW2JSR8_9ACTN